MQKPILSTFFVLNFLIILTHSEEKFLHVYENDYLSEKSSKPLVISNSNQDLVEALHHRYRRDIGSDRNEGFKNITTRVIKFFHSLSLINHSDSLIFRTKNTPTR